MTTFYLDPEGGDDFGSDFSLQGRNPTANSVSSVAVAKYGSRSLDFSSTAASRLSFSVPNFTNYQMNGFPFTAEAWVYFTSHSATTVETMFGQWTDGGASGLSWRVGMNASGQLQYQWSTSGNTSTGTLVAAWTPTLNQWYHIALDKDGTTTRLYVDGAVVNSVADASVLSQQTSNFIIGNDNSTAKRFPGYIQDFRLTRGVARYAGAFTPPAAALPSSYKDDPYFNHVSLLVPGRGDGTGTSFANRWRTVQTGAIAARHAAGDTIRLRATPDDTLVGNATWTQNSKTVTLAAAVTANIDTCDTAWTAAANVTATAQATTSRREGTAYAQFVVAAAFTTGKIAYRATGALDLSAYQQLCFWFQANNTAGSGTIRLMLCSDTTGDVPIKSFYIPEYLATGTWMPMVFDTGAALPSNVQSVALYADTDPGTVNFWLDNIFAAKASSSPDALTLRSLIGKVHNKSWAASTVYSLGDRRRPTQVNRNGFLYQVTASLAGTSHRYWRINISANNGSLGTTIITEFEMRTAQGGSNVVSGGTALASSEMGSGLAASKAFDGSTSTYWASTNPVATLQYDYGAGNAKTIVEVALRCAPGGESPVTAPKDFTIQYSDDGAAWTTVYTATNQTSWTTGELRTYTFPASATSGSTEPSWPAAWGKTVTDGTAVWTCINAELEDSWFGICGINGTTVSLDNHLAGSFTALRGYHGATETVATYKRETAQMFPVPPNFSNTNLINKGGTLGLPITYSGGWNRTDMSAQDGGETWWDGMNGNGNGLYVGSNKYINLDHFNFVRFNAAVVGASSGSGVVSNCHANNNVNGFLLSGSQSQWNLYGVHGFNNGGTGVSCQTAGVVIARAIQGCSGGQAAVDTLGVQFAKYKNRMNYVVARNNGGNGLGTYSTPVYDSIVSNYATGSNAASSVSGGSDYNSICYVNGNCTEASYINQGNLGPFAYVDGYIYSHKHNGDANDHRIYFNEGTVRSDVAQRHTASGLSWKCSLTAGFRTQNYPVRFSLGRYLLQANVAKTFKVWSRRDLASIKGALLIYGGSLAGIDADALASVDPVALNTWEQAAGLTVTPLESGVVELWMLWWDGVGTTGNYWIDDLTVT